MKKYLEQTGNSLTKYSVKGKGALPPGQYKLTLTKQSISPYGAIDLVFDTGIEPYTTNVPFDRFEEVTGGQAFVEGQTYVLTIALTDGVAVVSLDGGFNLIEYPNSKLLFERAKSIAEVLEYVREHKLKVASPYLERAELNVPFSTQTKGSASLASPSSGQRASTESN